MTAVLVRPFHRRDRDQLTALVNAHIAAVIPGVSISVNTVLSTLEREPDEFIVDPWVIDRVTLVAEQRGRVVAAAHLLRYSSAEPVGTSYRDTGEIRWLLCGVNASFWPDATEAGDALVSACLAQLERWRVRTWYADGTLPAPGVYGVPEQWPHIRELYARAGFPLQGRTEIVYLASVADLGSADTDRGLVARRTLGINGTRFSALLGDEVVGFIEVDTNLEEGARLSRLRGWADVGNLEVAEAHRRQGIGSWLLQQAAGWLRLGGVERLLAYAVPDERELISFLERNRFRELTRTIRGLQQPARSLSFD